MSKATAKPNPTSTRWVSFDGLRWAAEQMARKDLADGAKLVLFALAAHVGDDDGTCWPSIDRLAAMTGRSRQGTKNAIEALVESGLVRVASRQDDLGRHLSNVYRLELGPYRPNDTIGRGQVLSPKYSTTEELEGESTAREADLFGAPAGTTPHALATMMMQAWEANRGALPAWRVVTPAQSRAIVKRVAELPIAEWPKVVAALARSRWVVERRMGPDFLLREATWQRALAGEIERWGLTSMNGQSSFAPSSAQSTKRRIDASGGDDHLAEALRRGQEDDGGL